MKLDENLEINLIVRDTQPWVKARQFHSSHLISWVVVGRRVLHRNHTVSPPTVINNSPSCIFHDWLIIRGEPADRECVFSVNSPLKQVIKQIFRVCQESVKASKRSMLSLSVAETHNSWFRHHGCINSAKVNTVTSTKCVKPETQTASFVLDLVLKPDWQNAIMGNLTATEKTFHVFWFMLQSNLTALPSNASVTEEGQHEQTGSVQWKNKHDDACLSS